MTPRMLVVRANEAGYEIEVGGAGPALVPYVDGAKCPPRLLADLKAHREELVRHLRLSGLLARASENRCKVYGYDSRDGAVTALIHSRGVPDEWDRVCVEGDTNWTMIPRANQ